MLDNIKACVFDLDGTLVDSLHIWRDIDVEYLARYGIDCPHDLDHHIGGMSFTETAVYFKEYFNLPVGVDKIRSDWEDMALYKYLYEVELKPGVMDFLECIREKDIPIAIATSNSRLMVDKFLRERNLSTYFDAVVTSCEVNKGKPAPDVYLRAAELISIKPADCLAFEDIPDGIRAAKSAGMKVCAVEDRHSEHIRDKKMELADYYIYDFTNIVKV